MVFQKGELGELNKTIKESVMGGDNQQWYSNKEIFEMVMHEIKKLTEKLTETNNKISKYNGLRDDLDNACQELNQLKLIVKLMIWGYAIAGGVIVTALITDIVNMF